MALDAVASRKLETFKPAWKSGRQRVRRDGFRRVSGILRDRERRSTGLAEAGQLPDVAVFHAGTKREGDSIVTSGGRVLGVTATADCLEQAIRKAYEAVDKIHFDGAQYRTDIGAKGDLRWSVPAGVPRV